MTNRFHIAIQAGNLDIALKFYCDILGCSKGNSEINETNSWADIDFWGNELTLHATPPKPDSNVAVHCVDIEEVIVPHFGVHLDSMQFKSLKRLLQEKNITFLSEPYIRFKNSSLEQETFFIEDPNNNVIEIKTMKIPEALFENHYN